MSRTYRCRVKRDLTEVIKERDSIVYRLKRLPVADKKKMNRWFRRALLEDGAGENEDGTLEMEFDGVRVEIDLEKEEVRATSEIEDELHIRIDEERSEYDYGDNKERAQEKAEKHVDREIAKKVKATRARHKKAAVGKLNEAQDQIKERIRTAENKVVEKALDEKTKTLGKNVQKEEEVEIDGGKRLVWSVNLN
ncbi:MAG: hypothetical protein GY866_08190 [Proteobacteria bacterium]|nr:hypothetical protein [Pseudomonadota bacterium]